MCDKSYWLTDRRLFQCPPAAHRVETTSLRTMRAQAPSPVRVKSGRSLGRGMMGPWWKHSGGNIEVLQPSSSPPHLDGRGAQREPALTEEMLCSPNIPIKPFRLIHGVIIRGCGGIRRVITPLPPPLPVSVYMWGELSMFLPILRGRANLIGCSALTHNSMHG